VDRPPISVIIPTYNRAAQLPDAVRSVQEQTRQDWELIIVDDGSTDGTAAVVETLMRQDRRLRLLANEGVRGPGGARNAGIRAARGEVIAFLDSDDLWEPENLARFMERFDSDEGAVLVGSDIRMIDRERGSTTTMKSFLLETMVPWWRREPLVCAVMSPQALCDNIETITRPGLLLSLTIAGFSWVHTSSAMIRRDAALTAGLFDERLLRTEDIDLWLKLERMGRFVYIDEVLATYDITGRHDGSGSRYRLYDPSRRHSAYVEALYHLRLLNRIERSYSLTADQVRLLKHRRISHHRHCAVTALRQRYWPGLLHALPCFRSESEATRLFEELRTVLFRGETTSGRDDNVGA
jgi:glycosyltransferase involved in cell wall biosynthesis